MDSALIGFDRRTGTRDRRVNAWDRRKSKQDRRSYAIVGTDTIQ